MQFALLILLNIVISVSIGIGIYYSLELKSNNPIIYNNTYHIEIDYLSEVDDKYVKIINEAAEKWSIIINKELPTKYNYENRTIDNLLIQIDIKPIDNIGNKVGSAGPRIIDETYPYYTRVGLIQIDSHDIEKIYNDNLLLYTILHEIGHIIGIGTLWNTLKLLNNDHVYVGKGGIYGNSLINGPKNGPIIDTTGPVGTSFSHWDSKTYPNEIMSGYLNHNMKISNLTVQSLRDLGYNYINIDFVDSYTINPRSNFRTLNQKKTLYEFNPISF